MSLEQATPFRPLCENGSLVARNEPFKNIGPSNIACLLCSMVSKSVVHFCLATNHLNHEK